MSAGTSPEADTCQKAYKERTKRCIKKITRSKNPTYFFKETLNLKFRQETLMETQKLGHEVQMMKKEQEASANKLEALEKENHILQITLQQRDAEIERQHNVVE